MERTERTTRRYRMTCRRCAGSWVATYEVVAFHDSEGDHELFYANGLPALAPWSGVSCPECDDQRVKVFPLGRYAVSGTGIV